MILHELLIFKLWQGVESWSRGRRQTRDRQQLEMEFPERKEVTGSQSQEPPPPRKASEIYLAMATRSVLVWVVNSMMGANRKYYLKLCKLWKRFTVQAVQLFGLFSTYQTFLYLPKNVLNRRMSTAWTRSRFQRKTRKWVRRKDSVALPHSFPSPLSYWSSTIQLNQIAEYFLQNSGIFYPKLKSRWNSSLVQGDNTCKTRAPLFIWGLCDCPTKPDANVVGVCPPACLFDMKLMILSLWLPSLNPKYSTKCLQSHCIWS